MLKDKVGSSHVKDLNGSSVEISTSPFRGLFLINVQFEMGWNECEFRLTVIINVYICMRSYPSMSVRYGIRSATQESAGMVGMLWLPAPSAASRCC